VVNAGGAWAGKIAALAGIRLPMRCSKGSLLVTAARLTRRVINRLRSPSDGDILMPAGTVSVLGTTSERVHSPDRIFPELREIDLLIEQGSAMVPALETARAIRAYCGVRALSGGKEGGDDRDASRGFLLLDHAEGEERIENLITITGGKLTTFRLMAEKTADRVCEKLGISEPCRTAEEPLPDAKTARWTEPGLAPRTWVRSGDCSDAPLCLCELVPENVVEDLAEALEEEGARPNLRALGVRSRVGKGPCQGTFCSQRIAARLYDRGTFSGREGIAQLRAFLSERWRGRRLLLEDASLAQAELLEAMHCALFGLELEEEGGGPLRREEDRHDRA